MAPLTDVAVFVQVVDSGSFTAAAEKLQMSRAAVSKYVTRLENQLGARLLNRTTRRLSLTEVGRNYYERSRNALLELEEAELEVSRFQGAPRGNLRISVPMSFGILHISPIIAEFLKQYPEVTIDLLLDDRKVDVVDGGFDLAIRISSLPDSSLIARRLAPCRHVICATPGYIEQRGVPKVPADLAEHTIITYRYQESTYEWHFRSAAGKEIVVPVSSSSQMNNSLAIREAVLRHAGITRTPTFVVGPDLASGRLVALLTDFAILEISIYAVYASRQFLSPKVRAFVDFIAERIADPPHWDSALPG